MGAAITPAACFCAVSSTRRVILSKALEAHAFQHLVFEILATEVVERLQKQHPHHDLSGLGRATASRTISPGSGLVHRYGYCPEIDQLVVLYQESSHVVADLGMAVRLEEHVRLGR